MDASDGGGLYRRLLTDPQLVLIFLLSFAALSASNAVPASLPSIGSAFGATESGLGLVMTAFYLPMIVMVPVTGVLTDLYGRRPIVLFSLSLIGVTGVAALFVTTFAGLLAIRALQGVGFAGTIPLAATLVGDRYTGVEGSTAQGMRASVNGLGSTIGALAGGFLAAITWNYAFLLFSFAFPVVLLVFRYYREPVDDTLGRSAPAAEVRREFARYWASVRAEATDRIFPVLFGGMFVLFVVKQGIRTFVPVFAVGEIGLSVAEGGMILATYGAVRIVVPPAAGPVVRWIGRKPTLVAAFLVLAAGAGLVPQMSGLVALGLVVGVVATGDGLMNPVLNDAIADFASEEHLGGIMSGRGVFIMVANTVAPVVLGLVITVSGFVAMYLLLAVLCVTYGVLIGLAAFPDR